MFEKTPNYAPTHSITSIFRSFLSRGFRDPWQTGAVAPSSRALAMVMARQVLPCGSGTIVELGPGTGAITTALLDLGVSPDRLYLVERSPVFASILRMRFPGIRMVEGDALRLHEFAERDGVKDIAVVVSGLPLRLIDQTTRALILLRSFEIMGKLGSFIQFTYNHRPPVSLAHIASLGLDARCVGFVWRNLPPASIWEFRRTKSPKAAVGSASQHPARLLAHGADTGGPQQRSALFSAVAGHGQCPRRPRGHPENVRGAMQVRSPASNDEIDNG